MSRYNGTRLHDVQQWVRHGAGVGSRPRFGMGQWYALDADGVARMCLGGYAAYRAGAEFVWGEDVRTGLPRVYDCVIGGRRGLVSHVAQRLLGLGGDEAAVLFDLDEQYEEGQVLHLLDVLCERADRGARNLDLEGVCDFLEQCPIDLLA